MLTRYHLLTLVTCLATTGCSGEFSPPGGGGNGQPDAFVPQPFQADPPSVYVAKVKNLLVGLPPTNAEIQAVVADSGALPGLIDGWMNQPEFKPQYDQKMLRFFELAFQQTQLTTASFVDIRKQGIGKLTVPQTSLLLQNVEESYARTVQVLLGQGKPFTEVITTQQFMMTPPLMELYAFFDTQYLDDDGNVQDQFPSMTGNVTVYIGSQQVPLSDSLNPSSPNYMHFYDAAVPNLRLDDPSCDPLVWRRLQSDALHEWFGGFLGGIYYTSPTGVTCTGPTGSASNPPFTSADYNNWKMVTIRAQRQGESITKFWDVPALRNATELVLKTPRLGFFSTPAFHGNWSTNLSNQMRVTANQALIVALGQPIDTTDATVPPSTPGLDASHAAPGTACYQCHQHLDPIRSILAANYSWGYGQQTDPAYVNQPGLFAFEGVIKPVSTLDDFGTALVTHPLFAQAWVQKLCYYANSAPCEPTDPEFQRIVSNFTNSNYQWSSMVRDLLSSPLITNAAPTKTAEINGEVVAVSRRDQLCAALNNRLGLTDVCVLNPADLPRRPTTTELIVGGLPSDGYGRGSATPILPNQPTLFYRSGVENICQDISQTVIDGPNAKWSSSQPDEAIADFVALLLGFTSSDPRAAQATTLLRSHFDQAVMSGQTASNSLKSTFTVSCLSPSFVGIGM